VRVKKQPVADRFVSIVDDDASVRRSTGRLIRSLGLQAETFASADDFLSSGRADQTACLLLDVRMPSMNGEEVLDRLSAMECIVPVIVITAHEDDCTRLRSRFADAAVAFRAKPVNDEALLRDIRTAVQSRRE